MNLQALSKNLRLRKRRGANLAIVFIGVVFVIMIFAMFFLELIKIYDIQYAIEVRAQRAINSAVEYAMDDAQRADGKNIMDKTKANAVLLQYLREDLNVDSAGRCYDSNGKLIYRVSFGTAYMDDGKVSHTPSITIDITVDIVTSYGSFFNNRTGSWHWTNTYKSQNFRVDENKRAGW